MPVVVLMLDGWEDSLGVEAEIRVVRELGKPVRSLEEEAFVAPTSSHECERGGCRLASMSPASSLLALP